ncbi:MAG: NosD domain-containing protein, partial [Candidatus Thorarchaeota archaeon]
IGIAIFLCLNILVYQENFGLTTPQRTQQFAFSHSVPSYTPSAPILIQSDADFETQSWPGAGTEEDPYLIWNLVITSDDYCILIENTTVHFEIGDCNLTKTTTGDVVFLRNVTNGKIESTKFGGGYYAVRLLNTSNCVISNCEVFSSVQFGITVSETSNASIRDCTIIGTLGSGTALNLGASEDCVVFNNIVTNMAYGFRINNVVNCSFSYNTLTNLTDNGIEGTSISGIFSYNTITGTHIGLWIYGENNHIEGNILNDNVVGMQVNSKDTMVLGNTACDNVNGITITVMDGNVTVQSNFVKDNERGFLLDSTNISVLDNIAENNYYGYYLTRGEITLTNNTSQGEWYGFIVDDEDYIEFRENTINNTRFAFSLTDTHYCSIIDNHISMAYYGIIVDNIIWSSETLIRGNVIENSVIGIRISESWAANITENTFFNISEYGVYLYDVHNCYLTRNWVYNAKWAGFWLLDDSDTRVLENNLDDASIILIDSGGVVVERNNLSSGGLFVAGEQTWNWVHSVSDNLVNGKPIGYVIGSNNLNVDLSSYGQIFLVDSTNSTLRDGVFNNVRVAVSVAFCQNVTIESCSISDCELGVSFSNTTTSRVENCFITMIDGYPVDGLLVWAGSGVVVYRSERCNFTDLISIYCQWNGIDFRESSNCRVESSTFARNQVGVYLSSANCTIIDCLFRLNGYGIKLLNSYSTGNRIFYNRFEISNLTQATDDVTIAPFNYWDDGASLGNYWSDYSGSGTYLVDGSAGSVDRYPRYLEVVPVMDHPADQSYDEGTIGHSILWSPLDNNPSEWRVYKNDSLIDFGIWDGSTVQVIIDGYIPGVWNITLIIIDSADNYATDIVLVTVIDVIAPIVDDQTDRQFSEVETGLFIIWTPYDSNPSWYMIYLNGSEHVSEEWNGSAIAVSLDGLSPGTYNFTLVVMDGVGAYAHDSVFIQVSAEVIITTPTTPTSTISTPTSTSTTTTELTSSPTTTPSEFDPTLIILMSGGVIGALVIVIILSKRK